jgi:parvulin-like peptidyl-prolyl isomerase
MPAVLSSVGCEQLSPPAATVHDSVAQGHGKPTPTPGTMPAEKTAGPARPGKPIATVNDVPIERTALIQMLVEGRGLDLLRQMVLQETARQEATRQGLSISSADTDHEYDLTLQAARYDGKDIENLTPARREQMIEDWTRSRGVTRQELAVAMTRQAYLRKIAEKGVRIDDGMMEKEFKRTHGEKAEVRHIQLAAPRVWEQLRQRLDAGEDFEVLVKDFSQNALSREKNGLLPPFTADDPTVPAAFAKAAFAMEVGQASNPIEAEGSYHVLKLERRLPAEDVTIDQVRDKLRDNLFARLVAERMDQLAGELLMRAKLRIEDPTLRDQYKKRQAANDFTGPPLIGQ